MTRENIDALGLPGPADRPPPPPPVSSGRRPSNTSLDALGGVARALTDAVDQLDGLEQLLVKEEGVYKVAFAKALLRSDGSVANREAQATIDTEELRTAFRCAEAKVRVQREHIKALHARIDVGRTYVSTERQIAGVS